MFRKVTFTMYPVQDWKRARAFYGEFAAILLIAMIPAHAGTISSAEPTLLELVMKTREARLAGDNEGWLEHGKETLARAPNHPDLLLSTARALAANGRTGEALDLLEQAIGRGARVDAGALLEFKDLVGNERFRALAAKGLENLRPVSPPKVFVIVEDTGIKPEGIAHDPDTARLFISSLNREIWQIDMKGQIKRFAAPETGLREVLGLKVDRRRRLLWAATGVFPDLFVAEAAPKEDVGLSGVLAFNLDNGERVSECWLDERPLEHGFNDLALAENGDVYVSDTSTNSIYRLPGGDCKLERLLRDSRMSFPNGIVLSPDETRLYVAHVEGLSVIDLKTGRRTALTVPANASVNSLDGLTHDGVDLIGIQPSPYLARVARIRLSDDGAAVREVVTVSSPPPAGTSQTTGVIVGTHFFSVAGTLDPLVTADEPDRRARILRTNLH